jgi:hypothetical protein
MPGGQTTTLFLVGHFSERASVSTDPEEFKRYFSNVDRLEAIVRWRYWRAKKPLLSFIGLARDEQEATWKYTTAEVNVANLRDYVEKNS